MGDQQNKAVGRNFSSYPTTPATPKNSNLSVPNFSSNDLFGSANEITIEHESFLYRLRITKQGKLILNK